jgi:hypothetical protein
MRNHVIAKDKMVAIGQELLYGKGSRLEKRLT